MADHKHNSSNKPRFSAGMITGIVTVAWLVVFGVVTMYGIGGVKQLDHVVTSQAD